MTRSYAPSTPLALSIIGMILTAVIICLSGIFIGLVASSGTYVLAFSLGLTVQSCEILAMMVLMPSMTISCVRLVDPVMDQIDKIKRRI